MRRLLLLSAALSSAALSLASCAEKPVTREEPPESAGPAQAPAPERAVTEPSAHAAPGVTAPGNAAPGDLAPVQAAREAPAEEGPWLPADGRVRRPPAYDRGELPLAPIARYHPALDFLQAGSVSVGTSSDGYLVRASHMPLEGPFHRFMTTQAARGTNAGTDELVGALLKAAERVAKRFPGTRLQMGNIARDGGGDIPWSRSHNSGRDADIGFFVLDAHGQLVDLHDLVRLNRLGEGTIAGEPVRFDAERTWVLVKALLTDPGIRLQYLFISKPLRAKVLAVAERHHEKADLVERAAAVLRQPLGAAAHDDHLHVRIVCPDPDLAEGCVDTMQLPDGYTPDTRGRQVAITRARRLLDAPEAPTRRDAVAFLRIVDAREVSTQVVPLIADSDASVRAEALRTVVALRERSATPAISAQLAVEPDPAVAAQAIDTLAELGDTPSSRALASVVAAARTLTDSAGAVTPLRRLAAKALRLAPPDTRVLQVLADALVDPDVDTRQALLDALAFATNQRLRGADADNPEAARDAWRAWLGREGRKDSAAWWRDGFQAAGFALRRLDKRAAPELLSAVSAPEPVSTNAVRQLMRITRHDGGATLGWSRLERRGYWQRFLKRHGYLGRTRRHR